MITNAEKMMILIGARERSRRDGAKERKLAIPRATQPRRCIKTAVEHCLIGAVSFASGIDWIPATPKRFVNGGVINLPIERTCSEEVALGAIDVLAEAIGDPLPLIDSTCRVAHWNDCEDRTHAEVLDALDRAIASLMNKGETVAERKLELAQ